MASSKVATSTRRPAPTPARRSPPPPPSRSASSKPSTPPPQRQAPPPAAGKPASTAPATQTEASKAPRKRSPPMERAVKFARLADKNLGRALRLVGNWRGEATAAQKAMNDEIVAKLKEAAPLVERALLDVGLLANSKFVPVEARGRAITEPFAAGERVAISEKQYKPALHGTVNDFEVVVQVENMVRLRPFGDLKATQLLVNRSHLVGLEDPEDEDDGGEGDGEDEGNDAEGESAGEDGAADAEAVTDGDGGVDPEETPELDFGE